MGTHVELLDRPRAIALPPAALAAMSDLALARRVLGGEERPFEVLYGRYKDPLYRYCAAFLRNAEDAEDALQAAMVNAFRALAQGVPGDLAVKPWLYRIAHRECLNIIRRRPSHEELTGVEEAPGTGVAEHAEHAEQLRQLAADLGALAPRARHALLLRELAGLSYGDIAAAMEVAEPVARNLVYEARQALEEINEGRLLGCADVRRTICEGDGRALRARRMSAHLRSCAGCRGYRDRIAKRSRLMAAMVPAGLPALASGRIFEIATGSLGTAGAGAVGAGATAAGAGAAAGSSIAGGTLGVKGLVLVVSALTAVAAPLAVEGVEAARPAVVVETAARAPAAALPSGVRVVVPGPPAPRLTPSALPASPPSPAPSAVTEGASPADAHDAPPPVSAVHDPAPDADAGRAAPAVHHGPPPADTAPVALAAPTQVPAAPPDTAAADSQAPSPRAGAAGKAETHSSPTAAGTPKRDARRPREVGFRGNAGGGGKAAAPGQAGRQQHLLAVEESLPASMSAQPPAVPSGQFPQPAAKTSVGQGGAPVDAGTTPGASDLAPGQAESPGGATAPGRSDAARQAAAVTDTAPAQPAADPRPAAPVTRTADGRAHARGTATPPGQAAKSAG